jgi:hypothetical protein
LLLAQAVVAAAQPIPYHNLNEDRRTSPSPTAAATNDKPSEVGSKKSMLKHHLVPAFGHLKLDQVGVREIEEYKARGAISRTRRPSSGCACQRRRSTSSHSRKQRD